MPSAERAGQFSSIAEQISRILGVSFALTRAQRAGGGCINEAWILSGTQERFFVKINASDRREMFEAELDGLHALARAGAVRVPQPVCVGSDGLSSWLVVEYIEFARHRDAADWRRLGTLLAAQHRRLGERFGWRRDNTIGSTPQPNRWNTDWVEFLREQRLGHQLGLAARNGYASALAERGARLLESLPAFFGGHRPQPSLLHGDLWSGNVAFTPAGEPVVFDPAVYYGDREADLAMTELFGGFAAPFYSAYREAWPLDAGYELRRRLYNLYHLLNHLNLFGPAYLDQCRAGIDWLLAQA